MELKVLKLNLQQTIIYEDVPSNCIAICAIHDKHKSLLVMHTDYSSLTNKVEDFLKTTDLKYARIIWGDGFHCDTWGGGIFHLDIDAEGIPTVGTYTEDNLNREGPTDSEKPGTWSGRYITNLLKWFNNR